MREVEERVARAYSERFGEAPELVASAPGRVNLIGEHTDYNGGFVLPCAIDQRVAVAVAKTTGEGSLYSADFGDECLLDGGPGGIWADYPRGVTQVLREESEGIGTFRAAFSGEVPRGSSLSSSAAIESATALALDALFGLGLDRRTLALACQRAENEFVGVQCGIMDQYASLLCEEGAALLIDCRSLEAEPLPLELEAAGLSLLVCDTRVERDLASGKTGYNDRRAACERASGQLGVELLRDATEESLSRLYGEELKRARHIVTENARVLASREALQEEDFGRLGELMYASHESMRDDYEISTQELDAFVELARHRDAPGARLTGAGFGGCAIALVATGEVAPLQEAVQENFFRRGFKEPAFYAFRPASGATLVDHETRRWS